VQLPLVQGRKPSVQDEHKPAIGTRLKQRVVAHRCAVDLEAAVPEASTSIAMVARVAGMSGATGVRRVEQDASPLLALEFAAAVAPSSDAILDVVEMFGGLTCLGRKGHGALSWIVHAARLVAVGVWRTCFGHPCAALRHGRWPSPQAWHFPPPFF
jgi:hypothetical protein